MQLFDVTGKTSLVSGASRGLGEQFPRLSSNQASAYVTGSVPTVDGGISWGG